MYKLTFDAGKPYGVEVQNETELKNELKRFYQAHKDNDYQFDVQVFNEKDEDISDSQFIQEMIGEIIE